ncbi:MAG: hypothetical protein GX580_01145 [Candidatus Hydrogenedens sp.]|nr:hypothetical protein [Candidatus Hydrogenedentota bacterium]NLF56225.1 hypothetical protein [Candidatus Hydrogenedens sp.]
MNHHDHRQQAYELVKEFCETVLQAGCREVDFYKLLWVADWGVEAFGAEKVRAMLEKILEESVEYSDTPERLRDRLFRQPTSDTEAWFDRAMKV